MPRSRHLFVSFPARSLARCYEGPRPFSFRLRVHGESPLPGDELWCSVTDGSWYYLHSVLVLDDVWRDGTEAGVRWLVQGNLQRSAYATHPWDAAAYASRLWRIAELQDPGRVAVVEGERRTVLARTLARVTPRIFDHDQRVAGVLSACLRPLRWFLLESPLAQTARIQPTTVSDICAILKRTVPLVDLVRYQTEDPYATATDVVAHHLGIRQTAKHGVSLPGNSWAALEEVQSDSDVLESAEDGLPHATLSPASSMLEHQRVVRVLARLLRGVGLRTWQSRHSDLVVLGDSWLIIFEVKSVTEDNVLEQVRAAVGQLLEYRYRYRALRPTCHLAFATGGLSKVEFVKGFLANIGIACVDVFDEQDVQLLLRWLENLSEYRLIRRTGQQGGEQPRCSVLPPD